MFAPRLFIVLKPTGDDGSRGDLGHGRIELGRGNVVLLS